MEIIRVKLILGEVELITNSLSKLPFKQVNMLIGRISEQVYTQIKSDVVTSNSNIDLELVEQDVSIIIKALSKYPFAKVHYIIKKIKAAENKRNNSNKIYN